MSYDSVTSDPTRLAKSKNFTLFYQDLAADTLPQWSFITPNMTNDVREASFLKIHSKHQSAEPSF
jgi:hypothetical protein